MESNLARAVRDKQPVPEIDFSLHQMEDGSQVSTMERVVKGKILECFRHTSPPVRLRSS